MVFKQLHLATVLCGLMASSAFAADVDYLDLLDVLKQNNSLTEQQHKSLVDALEDRAGNAEAEIQVATKGGLELGTYDGQFSFELGGRLMLDLAGYHEDQVKLGNGTEIRRARLEAEGIMYSDWGYEFGVDFAGADADIKDAYIEYRGSWPSTLKLGQFKEPFSLEELTSSRYITFMERALPNAFAPGRNIGMGYQSRGEGWITAIGLFGEAFDDDVANEGDEGWGVTTRVTYAPWRDGRKALHLGAALSVRTANDDNEVKFDSRPESHVTDVKYLNTGDITDVDTVSLLGLEAALVKGSWSLQGEAIQAQVSRSSGLATLDFSGWYVYGSWFLTGESRMYKAKKGSFGRIKPTGDSGAWELALRLSSLDLTDGPVTGGEADQLTLGLNWYVNPHLRMMMNYVRVDNDDFADDDGDAQGDDNPDILQLRAQIDF